MSNVTKRGLSTGALLAIALGLGAVVGVAGVYVTGMPSGNDEDGQVAGSAAGSCAGALDLAEKLEPLATGAVAAMAPVDQAQSVAKLAFQDPSNTPITLADISGKTTLVNLWATWCVPCRAEMPDLNNLQKELGSDNFEVVAINIDRGEPEKPKAFLDEIGVQDLAFYRDSTMAVFNDLKRDGLAFGLPVTMLVDEEGCLLAHMNGPAKWDHPDAIKLVEAALNRG